MIHLLVIDQSLCNSLFVHYVVLQGNGYVIYLCQVTIPTQRYIYDYIEA